MVVSRVWVCPRGGAGPVLSVIFEGGSASGRERINNPDITALAIATLCVIAYRNVGAFFGIL